MRLVRKAHQFVGGLATGGAWLFALGTCLLLLVALGLAVMTDGVAELKGDVVSIGRPEGRVHTIGGLSYRGWPGAILLAGELALVVLGMSLSCSQSVLPRHLGLVILAGWAGLWTIGFVRIHLATGALFGTMTVVIVLFLCTSVRTIVRWSGKPSSSGAVRQVIL